MPPIKKLEHEDKNALITLVCDSSTATEQNRHYLATQNFATFQGRDVRFDQLYTGQRHSVEHWKDTN